MHCLKLTEADHESLLDLAVASIDAGLAGGSMESVPAVPPSPALQTYRSTFVTLRVRGQLRGCCGTLEAQRPLAADVWHNAWAAAFADPRFSPLSPPEWLATELGISVLSPLTPLPARTERELLACIEPGSDGLLLEFGSARATFLPAVWEELPDPAAFIGHLKRKAGLATDFWSPRLSFQRYTSQSIGPRAIGGAAPAHRH